MLTIIRKILIFGFRSISVGIENSIVRIPADSIENRSSYFLSFKFLLKFTSVMNYISEQVSYTDDGLEAIVFTAQGDMRQALNNLQSTHNGFGHVNSENVFKVCDEPHPLLVKEMLEHCTQGDISKAYRVRYLVSGVHTRYCTINNFESFYLIQ